MEAGIDPMEGLAILREESRKGGGQARIDAIRKTGRHTARERINALVDENSFVEIDAFVKSRETEHGMDRNSILGDGVMAGSATIEGRRILCFAQDFSVFGGSMGEMHAQKIVKIIDMALKSRLPIIGIWDGGGQRAHEGVSALGATGELMDRLIACSGRIPMISLVLGPVVGASALAAAIADFVIIGEEHGEFFLSSPLETPEVADEGMSSRDLGGAEMHASRSGIASLVANDEEDAMDIVAEILSYFPDHCDALPPILPTSDSDDRSCESLSEIVPDDSNRPYDMKKIIGEVVDENRFLELQPLYAENIIIGFARLGGSPIGIIANQPKVLAGCLDIDASVKAARFIRTCDCFNIPLVSFVDVPGFLPGTVQEWGGIIRHGAKLLYAYAEATVPQLTVVTRKAYGGAYLAMSCKHLESDYNVSWPSGELAVMGAEGAVNIIHRRELKDSDDPVSKHSELVSEYRQKFGDPYVAARNGWLDDVIEPNETRIRLIRALKPLISKRVWQPPRKHGNIPL